MSSEHHCKPLQEGEEGQEEEAKEEESKEEEQDKEEELHDECAGSFPDSMYPPPLVLNKEVPDDLPGQADQEQPPDEWYCPHCC